MAIEIDRQNPFIPICRDESGKRCVHNGEVCACSVYAGDGNLKNKFEAK